MTWHDAEEDASNLDDEALIQRLIGIDPSRQTASNAAGTALPDWPARRGSPSRVEIDADIADWFREHTPRWQRDINAILRAWIATRPS